MHIRTLAPRVLFRRTPRAIGLGLLFVSVILSNTFLPAPKPLEAATSSNLNYHARLLSYNGNIVQDGYYNIEFKLYNVSSGGTALWTETYNDTNGAGAGNDYRVRVVNGYMSVNLGSRTAFPAINWDQDLWLTMNVGGRDQTTPVWDGEMSPRVKLTAVPYAFQSGDSDKLDGIDSAGFAQLAPGAIQGVNSANSALRLNQTGAGNILELQGGSSTVLSLDKTGTLTLGTGSTNTGRLVLANSANGNTVTIQSGATSTSYTLTLPLTVGSANECLMNSATPGTLTFGSCSGAGGSATLQQGYDNTADATPEIVLTSAQGVLSIQDAASALGTNLFEVTNNGGATKYLAVTSGGISVAGAGSFSSSVTVGTATAAGDLLLHDGSGQTTTLRAGNSTSNLTFYLPTADGSANNCLKTDGSGQLQFANCNNGSGSGGAITLQDAYTGGNTITTSSGRDLAFTLADTAIDSNFIVNISTGSTSKFAVQGNGTDLLAMSAAGQLALSVQGSTGGLVIGGDTNLYRSAANTLKTDDSLQISGALQSLASGNLLQAQLSGGVLTGYKSDGASVAYRLDNSDNATYRLQLSTHSATTVGLRVDNWSTQTGDWLQFADTTGTRLAVKASGEINWMGDTNLYRSAANILKTDDEFHSAGAVVANDSTAQQVRLISVGGNAGIDFGSSADTNLYRSAANTLTAGSSMIIQPATDSLNAFQVVSSGGGTFLSVDTVNGYVNLNGTTSPGNEIPNPGFEGGLTGSWYTYNPGISVITNAASAHSGNKYMEMASDATYKEAGPNKYYEVTPGQKIYLEGWFKRSVGSDGGAVIKIVFYDKDKTETSTSTTPSSNPTTSWSLQSVTATVPAGSFYMDAIISAPGNGTTGTVQFDDMYMTISSERAPMTFQNSTNSTAAFVIQNAAGTNLFRVDTTNERLAVGPAAIPANGLLTVGTDTTAASGGMYFGTDTNLYRSAAGTLRTDGDLRVVSKTGNSENAFSVDNNTGNRVFNVDTLNRSISINTNGDWPSYPALFVTSASTTQVTQALKAVNSQTADLLQLKNSGGSVIARFNVDGNLLAGSAATATTGTTTGTGSNTNTLTLTADAFAVNDVVFIDNAGQDYYTRVTADPGTGSYTVEPAVTFETGRTVTKYTIQNIGATATDYLTQSNRFFNGYFLGQVAVGAGTTKLSDGMLLMQGDTSLYRSGAGSLTLQGTGSATATTLGIKAVAGQTADLLQLQNSSGAILASIDATGRPTFNGPMTLKNPAYDGSRIGNVIVYDAGGGRVVNLLKDDPTGSFTIGDGANYIQGNIGQFNTITSISNGNYGPEIRPFITPIQVASNVGITIRGAASQTGDLQQWQGSDSSVLAKVDANGNATFNSINVGTSVTQQFTRSLPTSTGDYVEVFSFDGAASQSKQFDITITSTVAGTDGGVTKSYKFGVANNYPTTSLIPSFSEDRNPFDPSTPLNYDLELVDTAAGVKTVRVKRTAGVNAITLKITTRIDSSGAFNLTPLTGTGSSAIGNYGDIRLATSGGSLAVGTSAGSLGAKLYVRNTDNVANQVMVLQGTSGQVADLLQLRNSAGTILTSFDKDGKLVFGPSGSQDTNLYRSAANELKTDDRFYAGNGIQISNGNSGGPVLSQNGAGDGLSLSGGLVSVGAIQSGTYLEAYYSSGTATDVIRIGKIGPSGGASAEAGILLGGDTKLYRSAAGQLRTDGYLQPVISSSAVWATGLEGGIVYDDTANKFYIYDNGAKKELCNKTDLGCSAAGGGDAYLANTQTFTGANTFSNASNSFTGNGSGLTSLNGSNISSGTVADARLSSNVALLNANQIFTGTNTYRSATNSTAAFQIQNSTSSTLFKADTLNGLLQTSGDLSVGTAITNRLLSDSFESGNLQFWTSNSNASIDSTKSRAGSYSVALNQSASSGTLQYSKSLLGGTYYLRTYVNVASHSGADLALLEMRDNGNLYYYTVYRNTTGNICVSNGAASYTACDSQTLPLNEWHRLEMRLTSGSPGTFQVSYDGVQIFNLSQNVDPGIEGFLQTRLGGTGLGTSPTAVVNFDDVVLDTVSAGSAASLKVSDSLAVSGTLYVGSIAIFNNNLTANSSALFKTGSTTAFQIQNAAGTSNLFVADTTNTRIGIGTASPVSRLDVFSGAGTDATGLRITSSTGNYLAIYQDSGEESRIDSVGTNNGGLVINYDNGKPVTIGSTSTPSALNVRGTTNVRVDSTSAFQIQNSSSQNLFVADTTNQRVAVGPAAVPANGVLTVGTNTTTASGGLFFGTDTSLYRTNTSQLGIGLGGTLKYDFKQDSLWMGNISLQLDQYAASNTTALQTSVTAESLPRFLLQADGRLKWGDGTNSLDTNLYRSAATVLKTDGELQAGSALVANTGTAQQIRLISVGGNSGIDFGSSADTNLYRSGVNALKTDGQFTIGNGLQFSNGSAAADTNLYRASAGVLQTDGAIVSSRSGNLQAFTAYNTALGTVATFNMTANGVMAWGDGVNPQDTNLYRSAANTLKTDDNLLIQTASNSATAFQVQNALGHTLLTADTSNRRITLDDGQAALANVLVLDSSSAAPGTAINGSMYYDTTDNKLKCYEAGTWKNCIGAGGGGGNTRKIYLVPEYAGAVVSGDGSNNTGTMTSDMDDVNRHNYYQWVNSTGSLNDYDIKVRSQIPSEYASGFGTFKIWVYADSTSTANNDIQITVRDNSGTACASSVSVLPGSAATWVEQSVTLTGCTFAANDLVSITVRTMSATSNSVRVGEISYQYTN